MILRKQSPEANFEAMLAVADSFAQRGLQLKFIFDAVRQFGPAAAMEVVNAASRSQDRAGSIVAFGIGGDELSIETKEFRSVYDKAAGIGLHRLMHAGEVGGPDKIREAVELLGVERVGHGIAAVTRSRVDGLARGTPHTAGNLPRGEYLHRRTRKTTSAKRRADRRSPLAEIIAPWNSDRPFHRRPGDVSHDTARRVRKRRPHATHGTRNRIAAASQLRPRIRLRPRGIYNPGTVAEPTDCKP